MTLGRGIARFWKRCFQSAIKQKYEREAFKAELGLYKESAKAAEFHNFRISEVSQVFCKREQW